MKCSRLHIHTDDCVQRTAAAATPRRHVTVGQTVRCAVFHFWKPSYFGRSSAPRDDEDEPILHVLQWHPQEMARQLTLLEFELYQRVQVCVVRVRVRVLAAFGCVFASPSLTRACQLPELMNQNWTRKNASELAPNLTALISHFNRVSQVSGNGAREWVLRWRVCGGGVCMHSH
jgi:hypothetical protein